MANEINLQAVLGVQRATLSVQGAGNEAITPTGTKAAANQVTVSTTGWTAITLIESGTNAGYLYVKNTHDTNFVQLALDSGGTQVFAKLRKKEFCLVPLKDGTTQIWAQANTASVVIEVVAAQA